MLVSAELAKEKLALAVEKCLDAVYYGNGKYLAMLIRNTDLTDCQPEIQHVCGASGFNPMLGDVCERCDQLERNRTMRGVVDLENAGFEEDREEDVVIAPAPDQGSVRNATDRLMPKEPTPAMRDAFLDEWERMEEGTKNPSAWSCFYRAYGAMWLAAIRALPDQKD